VTKDPVTMVTSGDYQRYFEVDGKRYSHIVDPDTGYPVTWMRSVTVIGPADQSEAADANSTTLFLMPVKESMEYAEKNGIEAVWITDKGEDTDVKPTYTTSLYDVYVSDGLQDVIRLSSQG
ncbi:FAD:protein FMN transferase, partial [Faecalibaculum rodentium]